NEDSAATEELFSVPVDGSAAPTRLSGALSVQLNPSLGPIFQVSATNRVVFANVGGRELYSAPLDGSSAPVLISAPMVAGGSLSWGQWTPFEISPDGSHVAYVANQDTYATVELYCTPIDASSAPVKLSPPLGSSRGVLTDDGRGPDSDST